MTRSMAVAPSYELSSARAFDGAVWTQMRGEAAI